MKKVLKELFLVTPIAFLLFIVFLTPVGILYTFIKHVRKWDYKLEKQLYPIVRSFNLSMDGFACASAGEFLNDVLKVPKDSPIRYGSWRQTISAVSGLLYVFTKFNSKLRETLNKFEKDHCENAITPEDRYYWDNKYTTNIQTALTTLKK